MKRFIHSTRFALVLLLAGRVTTLAQSYTITDLGPGVANDINNSGHVVGTQTGVGGFYYDGRTTVTVTNKIVAGIVPPGYPDSGQPYYTTSVSSSATGINDADHIAGLNNGSSFLNINGVTDYGIGGLYETAVSAAVNNND